MQQFPNVNETDPSTGEIDQTAHDDQVVSYMGMASIAVSLRSYSPDQYVDYSYFMDEPGDDLRTSSSDDEETDDSDFADDLFNDEGLITSTENQQQYNTVLDKQNNNNNMDSDTGTPLEFIIPPPKKLTKIQEKSLDLLSLALSKGVPRKTSRALLSFFNDWITEEEFAFSTIVT
ncbi:hypothetical protein BDA99DRAFT_225713 [Phascolomyces articulosus]|uniref:Uncharacterized protein n=1 Tax=Phascolomyces articulosus TaxID=60185 RepID=A0AAD5K005_9FUNG|nr:hypothetical protein BDA99DRAFT_225713 [Phascolomyces articulosus]